MSFSKVDADLNKSFRLILSVLLVSTSAQTSYSQTPSMVKKSWGLVGAFGVEAPNAWKALKGDCAAVTVAVIDTGVDFTHPDLKESMWVNSKELNGKSGVDDDKNGYVDDVYGYDFVNKTGKTITDDHGHGTHIAGIIAAKAASDQGISGVCPGAKIMSLRYHGPKVSGTQALDFTIKSIYYAIQNGAKIINYSGGGRYFSAEEFTAMKAAESAGVLVIAAAGNETSNVDQEENKYYPASYGLSNIVSVGGIDPVGTKVKSSNWGQNSVDIAAPGKDILSTGRESTYQMLTGTSQATAFVSGVAAMILASDNKVSYTKVKEVIVASGKKTKSIASQVKSGSRVSALAAMRMIQKKNRITQKAVTKVKSDSKKRQSFSRSTATWNTYSSQKQKQQIHPVLNQ